MITCKAIRGQEPLQTQNYMTCCALLREKNRSRGQLPLAMLASVHFSSWLPLLYSRCLVHLDVLKVRSLHELNHDCCIW